MYQTLKAYCHGRITARREVAARQAEIVRLVRQAHVHITIFQILMGPGESV